MYFDVRDLDELLSEADDVLALLATPVARTKVERAAPRSKKASIPVDLECVEMIARLGRCKEILQRATGIEAVLAFRRLEELVRQAGLFAAHRQGNAIKRYTPCSCGGQVYLYVRGEDACAECYECRALDVRPYPVVS